MTDQRNIEDLVLAQLDDFHESRVPDITSRLAHAGRSVTWAQVREALDALAQDWRVIQTSPGWWRLP